MKPDESQAFFMKHNVVVHQQTSTRFPLQSFAAQKDLRCNRG